MESNEGRRQGWGRRLGEALPAGTRTSSHPRTRDEPILDLLLQLEIDAQLAEDRGHVPAGGRAAGARGEVWRFTAARCEGGWQGGLGNHVGSSQPARHTHMPTAQAHLCVMETLVTRDCDRHSVSPCASSSGGTYCAMECTCQVQGGGRE